MPPPPHSRSTEYVVSGLQARQFDLGIASLPVTAEGIRVTPLFEEEMVMVVNPEHAGLRKHRVTAHSAIDNHPSLSFP